MIDERTMTEMRVEELAAEPFEEAADWAADHLDQYRHAYVILSPGDMTAYRIMIIAPGPIWNGQPSHDHRYYHVALSMGLGLGYDWAGHPLEPGYVVQKWTRDCTGSDYHTACVLTRFLNVLADKLGDTT
jgi:hypothetical protein